MLKVLSGQNPNLIGIDRRGLWDRVGTGFSHQSGGPMIGFLWLCKKRKRPRHTYPRGDVMHPGVGSSLLLFDFTLVSQQVLLYIK